ncbi:MAG: C69 family dipeptidase [Bacteroidales bacterium]|nr:C69 family dipeptidase [Candidatus Latescibacterota bacterium]
MIRAPGVLFVILILVFIISLPVTGRTCTIIVAGKDATVDGSVITSHTDACDNSRLVYVPAMKFKKGSLAPVYWGLQDPAIAHGEWEVIGHIPQVAKTFAYFHSGYSHINEYQLAIGESTTSQREELGLDKGEGEQIITVEQAMIFALQRCKTAIDAVNLITSLVEEYGFLPSCGPASETLAIADPNEAWVLEIFSVGKGWKRESGKLGALWVAKRVPDDHIVMIPNWSIIQEIDLSRAGLSNSDQVDSDQAGSDLSTPDSFDRDKLMVSENYLKVAIEYGWYDPDSGFPFIWQDVYAPLPREWATSRSWLFYSSFCASLKDWPDRTIDKPREKNDSYHQYVEPLSLYPFSARPDTLISVQDIMAFQRSTFEGTIYDMTADYDWMIPDDEGKLVKSPLTTPFPTPDMRNLLDIDFRRNVSKGGYGMIAQLRSWLPDPVGGIYWFFVDNQHVGAYVPIYTGVTEIHESYGIWDPEKYDEASVRWAIDFVDNLLYLKWQEAINDVKEVRDPMEAAFFEEQAGIDEKAAALYERSPKKAAKYLTGITLDRMEKIHGIYSELRDQMITKYSNNRVRP